MIFRLKLIITMKKVYLSPEAEVLDVILSEGIMVMSDLRGGDYESFTTGSSIGSDED